MADLEEMSRFFEARTEGYDAHMLNEVEGCREGYEKMATLVSKDTRQLLDLGCGTGLELDQIFKVLPHIAVTGIDLTQAMLDKLRQKHPDKSMELICADYFSVKLPANRFDCAVSFQTMHHFSHARKAELYRRILDSLTPSGVYIECDYMVQTQEEEDFYFAENARLRREQNLPDSAFFHYDTPCTMENQMKLLLNAGFSNVELVFRMENTTMLIAKK